MAVGPGGASGLYAWLPASCAIEFGICLSILLNPVCFIYCSSNYTSCFFLCTPWRRRQCNNPYQEHNGTHCTSDMCNSSDHQYFLRRVPANLVASISPPNEVTVQGDEHIMVAEWQNQPCEKRHLCPIDGQWSAWGDLRSGRMEY